jgi:hypothetical protein
MKHAKINSQCIVQYIYAANIAFPTTFIWVQCLLSPTIYQLPSLFAQARGHHTEVGLYYTAVF